MPQPTCLRRRLALSVILAAIGAASIYAVPTTAAPSKRAGKKGGYVRVLVTLRRHSSSRSLRRLERRLGARPVRRIRHLRVIVVRVPRRKAKALVSRLKRSAAVAGVERDRVVMRITRFDAVQDPPSDPLYGQQWAAAVTEAPVAWAVTRGSANVVVAVLDTGVDFSQPDLQGAFVPGYDFVNNDADPSDDNGHGTFVAGIVAARANNGIGVSGFCPKCSIMPVKVTDASGSASESNVAAGITWAADHGARVINLSLGGNYGSTVASAVSYATNKGVLVVAAAGNNGSSNPFYPAADPGALSVAATQPDDQLYPWSDYGNWVAVAAPGCGTTTARNGQYAEVCGTSAATPVVSGLAALAISYSPSTSVDQIKHAITSSAQAMGGVTYGRVDVAGTLAALGATFQPAPAPAAPSAPPLPVAGPVAPAPTPAGGLAGSLQARQAVPGRRVIRFHRAKLRRGTRASRWVRRQRVELLRRTH